MQNENETKEEKKIIQQVKKTLLCLVYLIKYGVLGKFIISRIQKALFILSPPCMFF